MWWMGRNLRQEPQVLKCPGADLDLEGALEGMTSSTEHGLLLVGFPVNIPFPPKTSEGNILQIEEYFPRGDHFFLSFDYP